MKFPARLLALLALLTALHAQTPPALSLSPVETVITATRAEIWSDETETESHAIFEGNVVVTGTNLRITCDRLEITAVGKNSDKNATAQDIDNFKHILATGKVHIVQGDREAHCGRAEVLPREEKIVLTEKPIVIDRDAGATFTGDTLLLLKGERRVQGDNVRITFPPIKDLGFDKDAPAPRPAAAQP